VGSGLRIDARFDYFNQSDLRSGTDSVDRAALEVPSEEEIQRTTVNRNSTLGIDYSPLRAWGVNVQLPYFDRFHSTLAEGDSELSYSHSHGIGDVRVSLPGLQSGCELRRAAMGHASAIFAVCHKPGDLEFVAC
jgi:hypothetical protein